MTAVSRRPPPIAPRFQFSQRLRLMVPLAIAAISTGFNGVAIAEIVPDATLPQPSVAIDGEGGIEIGGGTTSGANLFHSFARFSLEGGRRATFVVPPEVDRVLARVTGDEIARIDGTLAALADLIFLAPNGIHFGDRARLEVSGSFLVTTASAIEFDDGRRWLAQASPASEAPLLSIAVPVGLTFAGESAAISMAGSGRAAQIDASDPLGGVSLEAIESGTIVEFADSLLSVLSGQTLAAIAGEIDIRRTQLYAPSGQVVLGSVRSGTVELADEFRFDRVELGGTIHLSERAMLLSDGTPSGTIVLAAETVTLESGGSVVLNNLGEDPSGAIRAIVADALTIDGFPTDGVGSSIYTNTFGSGTGGAIAIAAERLEMSGGASVNTATYGAGAGGTLSAEVGDLFLSGAAPDIGTGNVTSLATSTRSGGPGGDVTIDASSISLIDGGGIIGITIGTGASGDLRVTASESVRIEGSAGGILSSSIGTLTLVLGDAGDVEIRTPRLVLHNGGQVGSTTSAFGNAGDVSLVSDEAIVLSGRDDALGSSQILSLSESVATSGLVSPDFIRSAPQLAEIASIDNSGNSGNVSIATPSLFVTDGGRIQIANRGLGDSGNLSIVGDTVRLESGSRISAETLVGNGGQLDFDLRVLELDTGSILATTVGPGQGGNIRIRASERVEIVGEGIATIRDLISTAATDPVEALGNSVGLISGTARDGQAGDIAIDTGALVLRRGALIAPITLGAGDAGRTTLRVAGDAIVDASIITTATVGSGPDAGRGGDTSLEAENLTITAGGSIGTTTLGSGDSGTLRVGVRDRLSLSGQNRSFLNTPSSLASGAVTFEREVSGNGGDLLVSAARLDISNQATISASSGGRGNAGDVTIVTERLNLEGGATIAATSQSGQGGNLSLTARQSAVLRGGSQITTRAGRADTGDSNGGNLTIDTDLFAAIESSQIAANAFSGSGGNIRISTQSIFLGDSSRIDASSEVGIDGTVEVAAETATVNPNVQGLPSEVLAGTLLERGCASATRAHFSVIGRGRSLDFERPTLSTNPTWRDDRDWRTLEADSNAPTDSPPPENRQSPPLREADSWQRDDRGRLQLVTQSGASASPSSSCTVTEAQDRS